MDGEEFDEAFLRELDAVEASAVQHSHTLNDSAPAVSSTSNDTKQRAAAQTPRDSAMLQQSCSTGRGFKPACHHEASNIADLYRWAVDDISVLDDAATEGSAKDRIGQVLKSIMSILDARSTWCFPEYRTKNCSTSHTLSPKRDLSQHLLAAA